MKKKLLYKFYFFVYFTAVIIVVSRPCAAQAQAEQASEQVKKNINYILDELDFRNESVDKALEVVAEKSGLTIRAEEDAVGQITIYLKDINVYDALRIILDINKLAFYQEQEVVDVMTAEKFEKKYGRPFGHQVRSKIISLKYAQASALSETLRPMSSPAGKIIVDARENNLIIIDSQEIISSIEVLVQGFDVPVETRTFKLKYKNISDAADDVKILLSKGIGKLELDHKEKALIVTDTAKKLEEVGQWISQANRNGQEMTADVKVVQITLNDEHIMGVDWEAIVSNYQSVEFKGFDSKLNIIRKGIFKKKSYIDFGTISDEDLNILIEALDTVGIMRTVSEEELYISKEEEAYVAIKESDVSFLTEETEYQQRLKKSGKIRFTISSAPSVDDTYAFKIKPEHVSLESMEESDEPSQQEALVNIKPNNTIVIGGMFKDAVVDFTTKVPILGDLPLLGFAFSYEGQQERRTEIIIFITPKSSLEQ